MQQGNITRLEKVPGTAKIREDQFLHAQVVVAMPFVQIAQQAEEAARLNGFQLRLHGLQVRSKRQLAAVIKNQAVIRVDFLQVQRFGQGSTQRRKF